ncbi:MAG: glycogen synthase [Candidatus Omnitrophota bacterium]
MKVAFCSSEVFPYAKTGGLGDVSAALPQALVKAGVQVKVFMPLYKGIEPKEMHEGFGVTKQNQIETFFIKGDQYFLRDSIYVAEDGHDYPDSLERFSFFSKQVLEVLKRIDFCPDIIHCNDWQTSLINVYLKTFYKGDVFFKDTKCILTIHNLAYQGLSPKGKFSSLGISQAFFHKDYLEFHGKINLLKGGIVFSDLVTTVSPTYAKQIKTSQYGCGLEGILKAKGENLRGILNAIDYTIWNPETDEFIYKQYSASTFEAKAVNKINLQKELGLKEDKNILLMGMVSRLAEQKGIDILSKALDSILEKYQVVILGVGEPRYHQILKKKAIKFKGSFFLELKFDEALAHKIYAGVDVFLLPSRFEPCGLSQMISYKYATLPLVHHTGGLVDTVIDISAGGGGFVFNKYRALDLILAVEKVQKLFNQRKAWKGIAKKVTQYNFSWQAAAAKYIEAYKDLIRK